MTYVWDAFGALFKVNQPRWTIQYTYDAYDRCVEKFIYESRTGDLVSSEKYFYDGSEMIGVMRDDHIKYLKICHPETGKILAIEIDSTEYLPHLDLRGNISKLTSIETGEVYATFIHSAYGAYSIFDAKGNEVDPDTWDIPWTFKGKFRDSHTGLINFGRRWYHPTICRWISPDPLSYLDGDNLYTFCQNNPLRFDDLEGLLSYEEEQSYVYDDYEGMCPCGQQKYCPAGLKSYGKKKKSQEEKPKMRTLFINGIMTTKQEAEKHTAYLSKILGGRHVKLVYSPTQRIEPIEKIYDAISDITRQPIGRVVRLAAGFQDLAVAGYGKLGNETIGSRKLKQELIEFAKEAGPNDICAVVPHSRGAIETQVALTSGLPRCVTDRVITIAVAPAAYIKKGLCYDSKHFVSPYDLVPWLNFMDKENVDITWVPGKSFLMKDHCFDSPVYRTPLEESLKELRDKYAPMD